MALNKKKIKRVRRGIKQGRTQINTPDPTTFQRKNGRLIQRLVENNYSYKDRPGPVKKTGGKWVKKRKGLDSRW